MADRVRAAPPRNPTPAPDHLKPETRAWWNAVLAEWRIEPHQLRTLQCAAESWDMKEAARAALATHGLTFTDAKGMIRARPECAIERDSRVAYLRAMRELNLDVDPPKDLNRNSMIGISSWPPR